MGIIRPDRYDFFVSYSHADNDANYKFVDRFLEVLYSKLAAEFRSDETSESWFRDSIWLDNKGGLLSNGSLEAEISNGLSRSTFLLIFVGDKYSESEWVKRELDGFIDTRCKGKIDTARSHTFVVCMTEQGASKINEFGRGFATDRLADFWTHQIRKNFIGDNGRALPIYIPVMGRPQAVLNAAFQEGLDELVDTITARAKEDREVRGTIGQPYRKRPRRVALGVVTDDLIDARRELANLLQIAGIDVISLETNDLARGFSDHLGDCGLFIQPLSDARVLFTEWNSTGHLRRQGELAEKVTTLWWWSPNQAEGGAINPNKEDREDYCRDIATFRAIARVGSAKAIASQVDSWLSDGPLAAKVYIESNPNEPSHWIRIAAAIKEIWTHRNFELQFEGAALPQKESGSTEGIDEALRSCHGVMLLLGKKDFGALSVQATKLSVRLLRSGIMPARAVISFVPPWEPEIDYEWATIPFYEDRQTLNRERLEQFVDELHRAALQSVAVS